MKKLYTLSLLIASCVTFAQATDPFLGTVGTALNASPNGWQTHSGTAGQLVIVGGSLSYSSLPATGNKTQIVAGNSEDVNLVTAPLTGTAYYSAVINVLNADGLSPNTDPAGNYFFSLGATSGATVTALPARLYIRAGANAGTYNLGVLNNSGGTATPTFMSSDYDAGTPIFVVIKYDLASNTASLFANPSVGGAEGSATVTNVTGTTAAPTQIASVVIREAGNATAGTGNIEIDNVRVGGTWDYVVSGPLGTSHNSIAGLQVYPNPVTNGNLYITSDSNDTKSVAIYDVLGKQVVKTSTDNVVNVSNLKGGVYIVKITEAGKTATRKLVIK